MVTPRCQGLLNLIININSFKRRINVFLFFCNHNNNFSHKKIEKKIENKDKNQIKKILLEYSWGGVSIGTWDSQ